MERGLKQVGVLHVITSDGAETWLAGSGHVVLVEGRDWMSRPAQLEKELAARMSVQEMLSVVMMVEQDVR